MKLSVDEDYLSGVDSHSDCRRFGYVGGEIAHESRGAIGFISRALLRPLVRSATPPPPLFEEAHDILGSTD